MEPSLKHLNFEMRLIWNAKNYKPSLFCLSSLVRGSEHIISILEICLCLTRELGLADE